jgi:DNA-directed RNA polymerase subunit E"
VKRPMPEKACKNCHLLSNGPICPNCKSSNLSDDWTGLLIVIDAQTSEVAQKMGIKAPGRYAVRVR